MSFYRVFQTLYYSIIRLPFYQSLLLLSHSSLFSTEFLGKRVDTNSLVDGSVPLAHRRQELALSVRHVQFSPYEVM